MKQRASQPTITEIGARLLAEADARCGLTPSERHSPERLDKLARLVRIGRDRFMDAEGGSPDAHPDAVAA